MKQEKTLYAITVEDVINIAAENKVTISKKDWSFIEDKVGDFFGDSWREAIEYALDELEKSE